MLRFQVDKYLYKMHVVYAPQNEQQIGFRRFATSDCYRAFANQIRMPPAASMFVGVNVCNIIRSINNAI